MTEKTVVALKTEASLAVLSTQYRAKQAIERAQDSVDTTISRADRQLTSVQQLADRHLQTVESEVKAFRQNVNGQINELRIGLIEQVIQTRADVVTRADLLLPPAQSILKQVDTGLPYYLDCSAGMCVPNHIYGMLQESEKSSRAITKTMESIAAETPATAAAIRGVTEDVHTVTGRIAKPKSKKQKLLSTAVTLGVIAARAAF